MSCGIALKEKLGLIYSIAPKWMDREGFQRLERSFNLITSTIVHYVVFSLLILMVCAVNMTKFVGMNPKHWESADLGTEIEERSPGERSPNWGSFSHSMLSLFQISTMDWADIGREVILQEPWIAPFLLLFLL